MDLISGHWAYCSYGKNYEQDFMNATYSIHKIKKDALSEYYKVTKYDKLLEYPDDNKMFTVSDHL